MTERYGRVAIALHWIIALVPLAVFCKVAFFVGTKGFEPFKQLDNRIERRFVSPASAVTEFSSDCRARPLRQMDRTL